MDVNLKDVSVGAGKSNVNEKNKSMFNGATILVVSGIATVVAGVVTAFISKKRARQYLSLHGHEVDELPESGTALAFKALGLATLYTVGSFAVATFGLCKFFDINSMDDLRTKIRQNQKKRTPDPNERTEFENLSDFLTYLNDKYGKKDNEKS